jgi:murein L,D-transpeptidase YafK
VQRKPIVIIAALGLFAGLAAILLELGRRHAPGPLHTAPLAQRLAPGGFVPGQPVYLRLFKEERLLELWMERSGRFEKALSFPICAWSGTLGPKLKEGDGQSPEGFYLVSRRQLKPDSSFHRALNVGFPNAFDAAQGRTGSFLMIHGACVSIGCYAMTDAGIEDIYAAVEQALANGQEAVPVHIFPFRMTEQRLAATSAEPWHGFWQNLAEGDRLFHATGRPPRAYACGTRYGFASADGPPPAGCEAVRPW